MRVSLSLMTLIACLASAHAETVLERVEACDRWVGGTLENETHPERWGRAGNGLELRYITYPASGNSMVRKPFVRTEYFATPQHIDDPVAAWTPYQFIEELHGDDRGNVVLYTDETAWVVRFHVNHLVGKILRLPISVDRETHELVSIVPLEDKLVVLYCKSERKP